MNFQLDTTGVVLPPADETLWGPWSKTSDHNLCWSDLSPFTQGYVEALLHTPRIGYAGPRLGFSDLAPETLARIIADCEAVIKRTADRLFPVMYGGTFWMQRQARFPDVGAEDRGWGVAHFPPLNVQLGDDGKVRFA